MNTPTVRFSPSVSAALEQLGLNHAQDIATVGAARVFALLKAQGMTITRSVLWQLDAYARGVAAETLDEIRKNTLQAALKQLPPMPPQLSCDEMCAYMQTALDEADQAIWNGEVPVGAVIVADGKIIARAHNTCTADGLITRHAEINVIEQASVLLNTCRLDNCDLYVTLEPCAMCAGAISAARLRCLIYAAAEPKTGAAGSVIDLFAYPSINHHTAVIGGILAEQSRNRLQRFFATKRG